MKNSYKNIMDGAHHMRELFFIAEIHIFSLEWNIDNIKHKIKVSIKKFNRFLYALKQYCCMLTNDHM